MARPRPTTTAKGLGYRHRQQREHLLRLHVEGSPCGMCCQPMFKHQGLDADHSIPRALGGAHRLADRLVHASCNSRAGARLGNLLRRGDDWCDETANIVAPLAFPWPD
jgi:5-methylcytosine-specific restriction endonuclease McrA